MDYKVLICDLIGLKFGQNGQPDPGEVRAHIEAKGGVFHETNAGVAADGKIHFFYLPGLATEAEILALTDCGQFGAVIAAATILPKASRFRLGGVRIGSGTANMGSASWGGGDGIGGEAPLMNTPGFNSRATAHMVFKALLRVRPNLPVEDLHLRSVTGDFDTAHNLREYPTEKLEGQIFAILGYGNIGREVARLAYAFGMRVKVFARPAHRERVEADGFEFAPNAVAAASGAHILSIHTGLGAHVAGKYANARLINAEVFAVMSPQSVLINYDRGENVDIAALQAALASGQIQHAAIDADIFKSPDGTVAGPLAAYLPAAKKYPGRIALLPHAAADTDHPSRVAGAKQAVDQIFESILHKRVINLKGDLPVGYVNAGIVSGTADKHTG